MTTSVTEMLSREDANRRLEALRATIEARFGSVQEFVNLAEDYEIDRQEQVLYDQWRELRYLLSD